MSRCVPPMQNEEEELDDLMEEWNRLIRSEYLLEMHLDWIEDAIHEMHPDVDVARVIMIEVNCINDRTFSQRQSMLLRLQEPARNLVDAADCLIECIQAPLQTELDELQRLICINERKIQAHARKRCSIPNEEHHAKKARRE